MAMASSTVASPYLIRMGMCMVRTHNVTSSSRPAIYSVRMMSDEQRGHSSASDPLVSSVTSPYPVDPSTQRIRPPKPGKGANKGSRTWVDSLRVWCQAGRGGNGLPKKGGMGGKGGSCILECPEHPKMMPNLHHLFRTQFKGDPKKQKIVAEAGGHAAVVRLRGRDGRDTVVEVPVGVSVLDDDGRVLRDMNRPGSRLVVAVGGEPGGPANNWLGSRGQARHVRLELKLIADVGLVGFPNAGKSTLLKAVSRASPKIAGYPFTTLKPNLGHLKYEDERRISMADLPGLIEGAHYNVGMGHKFLKHVERTRVLLFVVDVRGFQLRMDSEYRTAFQTVALLNRELELYRRDLVDKPALCVVNKMDADGAEDMFKELRAALEDDEAYGRAVADLPEDMVPRERIRFDEIIPASAKYDPGSVAHVKERLRLWIDYHEQSRGQKLRADREAEAEEAGLITPVSQMRERLREANEPVGPSVV